MACVAVKVAMGVGRCVAWGRLHPIGICLLPVVVPVYVASRLAEGARSFYAHGKVQLWSAVSGASVLHILALAHLARSIGQSKCDMQAALAAAVLTASAVGCHLQEITCVLFSMSAVAALGYNALNQEALKLLLLTEMLNATFGRKTIYWNEETIRGMADGISSWTPRRPKIDFTGLIPSHITAIMNEDYESVFFKRRFRRAVNHYKMQGSNMKEQILSEHFIYYFTDAVDLQPLKKVRTSDLPPLVDSSDEENSDAPNWDPEQDDAVDSSSSSDGELDTRGPPRRTRCHAPTANTPGFLQDSRLTACIPEIADECRVSRELHGSLFVVDFGSRAVKPTTLYRYGSDSTRPDHLNLVAVRENGICYYSQLKLHDSASCRWLCESKGMYYQKYLVRQLLFLSPSKHIPFGDDVLVTTTTEADDTGLPNKYGVDRFEGMSSISPSLAARVLGLNVGDMTELYPPFQFRGIFFTNSGKSVLGKGMCKVDWSLEGDHLVLRSSCIKAESEGITDHLHYGMDVTKVFSRVMNAPTLNSSLLAALKLRALSVPESAREQANELLDRFVKECKDHSKRVMAKRACCIHTVHKQACRTQGDPSVYRRASINKGEQDIYDPSKDRTSCNDVRLEYCAPHEMEEYTANDLMEKKGRDPCPGNPALRTRSSLHIAASHYWSSYKSQAYDEKKWKQPKPKVQIKGLGLTLVALSDDRLAEGECIVISGGKVYEGPLSMFRCPTHAPWDIESHKAVQIPDSMKHEGIPDNCVILSSHGYVWRFIKGSRINHINEYNTQRVDASFARHAPNGTHAVPTTRLSTQGLLRARSGAGGDFVTPTPHPNCPFPLPTLLRAPGWFLPSRPNPESPNTWAS